MPFSSKAPSDPHIVSSQNSVDAGADLGTHHDVGALVPDPVVWDEFDVSPMTGWRWTNDPKLAFPPAIKIRNRNYRSRRQLDEFKSRLVKRALAKQGAS